MKEKVIKVEIVKNSSFEAADSFGNNEFRVNFFDLLVFPGFHGYYERIIDENSSYGTGLFVNFSDNLSSDMYNVVLRFRLIIDCILFKPKRLRAPRGYLWNCLVRLPLLKI